MSTSRLVPYVDIVVPSSHKYRRRRSPDRSPSISPTPGIAELATPNLSPRKKRRLDRNFTDDEISANLTRVKLERQLSPTASEFTFDPDSEAINVDTASQTSSDDVEGPGEDMASRRSPSLGNFSIVGTSSKGKAVDRGVAHYTVENETMEDQELVIDGESPPGDDDDSDVPVRLLSDFTIYNAKTMKLIPTAELLHMNFSNEKYGASGLVKPWIEPDMDDANEDEDAEDGSISDEGSDRICLSAIVEFSIHNLLEDEDGLDSKIYIRTEFGWYILGQPSDLYTPYFSEFWIQQRLVHLLVSAALEDSRITYQDFVKNLQCLDQYEDAVATAAAILGRELNFNDLKSDSSMAYLLSTLPDICAENGFKISRVPAVRELMGAMHYEFDDGDFSAQARPRSKKVIPRPTKKHQNKEKEVLKHRNQTFLTPIVNQIAKNLFEVPLEVAESTLDTDPDNTHIMLPHYKGHYSNPSKIIWRGKVKPGGVYESVNVDGVIYNIGDIVMVEPSDAEDGSVETLRESQTVNKYGNRCWFCQIQFFYEISEKGGNTKMFHGLWFAHGSKTLLQEISHSKALYLLQTCDDNPITSIFKKCNVKLMRPGDEEIEDDGSHDSNDFHCGQVLIYDEDEASFLDIPTNALKPNPGNSYRSCYACDLKADHDQTSKIDDSGPDVITVHGIDYHINDFVYVHPTNDTAVLDIVQITKIHKLQISVTFLGRYNDFVQYQKNQNTDSELIYDERRLFFTKKTDIIPAHKIDGICHVRHLTDEAKIEEWIQEDDHFYLNQEGSKKALCSIKREDFSFCKSCYMDDKKVKFKHKRFLQTNSKLVGMELFSGCGGLGIGMEMSGFVEIRYAVEFSPAAAKTYMRNHPHTTVYCQDSSSLLKHALDPNSDGTKMPLLSNINHKIICPPLPEKRDQIDFIFGGPPCQSFSHANHSKRRDDIRSTLACNMLGYVEHYEPSYFLLENVAGFLDHKFYTARETKSGKKVESEIRSGMVKFVVRTLIALGYQVRYKLLQAGQYGAPQSRKRVIFWGAKRGIALPDFPVPVYAFPLPAHHVKLPTGGKLSPPTRSKNPNDYHDFAPLKARTVYDAISDLPSFDWENPHYIIPETSRDRNEARKRREEFYIPCFNAVAKEGDGRFQSLPGFPEGGLYPTMAHNRYQRWLRQGMKEGDLVAGQYTTRHSSKVVEATVNVPLTPLADHRSLPAILLPKHAQPHAKKKNRTFYGRMDGDGHFKCALTTLSPILKNQWPVHPSQKRIISVREAARSQGFPDNYVFESTSKTPSRIVEDQLRQIGNAVAVPFALALGKELGKAMVLEWEKKEKEGSPPL